MGIQNQVGILAGCTISSSNTRLEIKNILNNESKEVKNC